MGVADRGMHGDMGVKSMWSHGGSREGHTGNGDAGEEKDSDIALGWGFHRSLGLLRGARG